MWRIALDEAPDSQINLGSVHGASKSNTLILDPRPAETKVEKNMLAWKIAIPSKCPPAPQDGLHHHENAPGGHMQRGRASGCTSNGTE